MSSRGPKQWQEELKAECRRLRVPEPIFNIVSDRRGGRTAWSATVTVQGVNVAARYWYDGQYIENAKDDAAEVMLTKLRNPSITAASQAQHQTRAGYGSGGWAR